MGDGGEVLTELAEQVDLAEVEPPLALGVIELAEGIALLREPGEELFAPKHGATGRGADTGDTGTPEELALGVYEPPLALVFGGAEAAGGLECGAVGPAAEAVAVGGSGVGGQVLLLLLPADGEVPVRMELAGPFLVGELPVAIHECLDLPGLNAEQLDLVDTEGEALLGLGHEDLEGGHVG